MKLGILKPGRVPDALHQRFGDYDGMFKRLLQHPDFSFTTYDILNGEIPESVHDADGWLITGSRHGVYEDHHWIPPIERFIRDCFAASRPLAGICFGHQLIAQAMGGKVEKFRGGWAVGARQYRTLAGENLSIMAFHQDQVVEKPAGAAAFMSNEFCAYAGLVYGQSAISLQPHPEFDADFMEQLVLDRSEVLEDHIQSHALQSINEPLSTSGVSKMLVDFFLDARAVLGGATISSSSV